MQYDHPYLASLSLLQRQSIIFLVRPVLSASSSFQSYRSVFTCLGKAKWGGGGGGMGVCVRDGSSLAPDPIVIRTYLCCSVPLLVIVLVIVLVLVLVLVQYSTVQYSTKYSKGGSFAHERPCASARDPRTLQYTTYVSTSVRQRLFDDRRSNICDQLRCFRFGLRETPPRDFQDLAMFKRIEQIAVECGSSLARPIRVCIDQFESEEEEDEEEDDHDRRRPSS